MSRFAAMIRSSCARVGRSRRRHAFLPLSQGGEALDALQVSLALSGNNRALVDAPLTAAAVVGELCSRRRSDGAKPRLSGFCGRGWSRRCGVPIATLACRFDVAHREVVRADSHAVDMTRRGARATEERQTTGRQSRLPSPSIRVGLNALICF